MTLDVTLPEVYTIFRVAGTGTPMDGETATLRLFGPPRYSHQDLPDFLGRFRFRTEEGTKGRGFVLENGAGAVQGHLVYQESFTVRPIANGDGA